MSELKRPTSATVSKKVAPGLTVVTLSRAGLEEIFVTATPGADGDFRPMFEKAIQAVGDRGGTIVAEDVFGVPALEEAEVAALHTVCCEPDWPITWLEEGASVGAALTGTQLYAVVGAPVERVQLEGRVVGSVYECAFARHCRLADIRPADTTGSRTAQAQATFQMMEAALAEVDMDFSNVVRTWLYLDQLLSWYGEFNRVRDAFFAARHVYEGLVPASTGIGGANMAGAALVANVYAMQAKTDDVHVTAVPSPLQCPALEYGSSFSRAAEVAMPDHRRLYVSGTASIEPGGETLHVDNMAKQIDLTMRVVAAILESRRMTWADANRAIAYVKHGREAGIFTQYCVDNNIVDMPVITAENDVCRDDLLFEIEVDAMVTGGNEGA